MAMKTLKLLSPKDAAEREAQRLDWAAEVDWLAGEIAKQAEAPAPRVFDQTWVDEKGETRYDFEIVGTGMSLREWNKDHGQL